MIKNLGFLTILLTAIALWACFREPPDTPGNWIRLELPDEQKTITWDRVGNQYVSKSTKVILSLAEVTQMRLDLRGSSRGRQYFAQEVGLTPEALLAHRSQILKSCDIDELPPELEKYLDYQTVLSNAQRLAFLEAEDLGSFGGQGMTLVLDGAPTLRVKRPSMIVSFIQPSSIECGGQSWETCSLKVSDVFKRLFEPDSKELSFDLAYGKFWSESVWSNNDGAFDASIWGELAGKYRTYRAMPAFRKRAGYEQLSQTFRVESLWAPNHGEFVTTLVPHRPTGLDLVDWNNMPHNMPGEPNLSPQPLLAILPIYQRCEADIVTQHRWLLDWKKSRVGRAIQLKVDCTVRGEHILSPWKEAGLPGVPEFEIELLDQERRCASLLLSSNAVPALITWATSKWRDGPLNYERNLDEVIEVDVTGQSHRKMIGVGKIRVTTAVDALTDSVIRFLSP